VKEISAVPRDGLPELGGYSRGTANALKGHAFDRKALGARGLRTNGSISSRSRSFSE